MILLEKKVDRVEKILKNELSETILRQAVILNNQSELKAIPSDEELSKLYSFSNRHNARMEALFAKENFRMACRRVFNSSKRIAVIIAVITSIVFGTLLTNRQVRASVSNAVIEWFDIFTHISFYNEEGNDEVLVDWFPTYLPEGFLETDKFMTVDFCSIEITNQENERIFMDYYFSDEITFSVDNEHSDYSVLFVSGIEYHIFETPSNAERAKVLWQKEGYSFSIESSLATDELMKIATSVVIVKN